MLSKPPACIDCVLEAYGKGFCPDLIAIGEQYCFFGEGPGTTEISVGRPFEGKAGFVLRSWLIKVVPELQLALERNQVSFRNVLHCLPPDNKGRAYPSGATKQKAEEQCKVYHSDIKAHTVILCGEVPQRFFFGPELEAEDVSDRRLGHDLKGVTGRVGRVYERDGKKWVFCLHPAYILRQPSMVAHGQSALGITTGKDKVVKPDYIGWDRAIEALG